MVNSCIIVCCRNRYIRRKAIKEARRDGDDETYTESILHKFPNPVTKPELRQEWIDVVRPYTNDPDLWIPTVSSRLCSDHFTKEDYYFIPQKISLTESAVPSIFIDTTNADVAEQLTPMFKLFTEENDQEYKNLTFKCEALGCPSRRDPVPDGEEDTCPVTFFEFPSLPRNQRRWIKALGRNDVSSWGRYKSVCANKRKYLCSLHFEPEELQQPKGKYARERPRRDVVPSVFELPDKDLWHLVDFSAPYLQPRVHLARCDGKEPPKKKPVLPLKPENVDSEEDVEEISEIEEENVEEEIARLRTLLDEMKSKVMSTSQKVKFLKISVSALKSQFLMERGDG